MSTPTTRNFLKGGKIMKKMWVSILAAALIVGFSLPAIAGSCGYVVNGDFEVTDTNAKILGSDFEYLEYPYSVCNEEYTNCEYKNDWLWWGGQMTIVDNPKKVHGYWPSFTHNGNMLVVNGQELEVGQEITPKTYVVWSQSFSLNPNTNYVLSFELANVSWLSPAEIYVIITHLSENGAPEQINDDPFTIPGVAGEEGKFEKFEMMINSGPTGKFELTFTNTTIAHSGNDFAMDNICLTGLMVDIKPGSCPNAFNLKQKGVIPVAIMGSEIFDVELIDQDSVWLCLANDDCIAPLRVETLDAGIPWMNQEDSCLPYSASFDEYGSYYDKLSDISLKFDSNELAVMLIGAGYEPGDFVPLTIKADYYYTDSSPKQELQGQDWIVIVNK